MKVGEIKFMIMKKMILGGIAAVAIAAIAFTAYGNNTVSDSFSTGGSVSCTCSSAQSKRCVANGDGTHTCRTTDENCWDSNKNCT